MYTEAKSNLTGQKTVSECFMGSSVITDLKHSCLSRESLHKTSKQNARGRSDAQQTPVHTRKGGVITCHTAKPVRPGVQELPGDAASWWLFSWVPGQGPSENTARHQSFGSKGAHPS